jgi:hypothetical protein
MRLGIDMKPSIPVLDTAMEVFELRRGAYVEKHKFEFWLWALTSIFAAVTVRLRDLVPGP